MKTVKSRYMSMREDGGSRDETLSFGVIPLDDKESYRLMDDDLQ